MTWLRRHADALIVAILAVALVGGSYWQSAAALSRSQHDWCATLDLLTRHRVPRPADPAANPSRENAYIYYSVFLEQRHRFGCG